MKHPSNSSAEENPDYPQKRDRSLLYMGIILGVIIGVMGYLTLFVDDVNNLFSPQKETISLINDKSDILDKNAGMSEEEVRSSLIKFIEAFYYDQSRGYFDPPSYFASITQTYYNFHNLTYQRLRDIHNKRLLEMENLNQNWIVSSLKFNRDSANLIATYWLKVSYFKPSWGKQESADIKQEMIINEDGKILSLKELEIKNFSSFVVVPDPDTLGGQETEWNTADGSSEADNQKPSDMQAEDPNATYDGRLYDLASIETAPEYPGGQKALGKYLGFNLKYPVAARENNIEGKVYISFIVEKNGQLSDLKITKGIGGGCDEEALRVFRNSSAWKPGLIGGNPVRTSYTMPIIFQMAN